MILTALTTLIGSFAMLSSWWFVGQRIKRSGGTVPAQVRYLRTFFLYMGNFFMIMFLPHLAIKTYPDQFPLLMAWGYVVGHIFLYLALLKVAQLLFSLAPRLAPKAKIMLSLGGIVAVLLTIANFITMVNGRRPEFDYEQSVTLFNAAPVVGAGIAFFAAITVFPTAILMVINGVRNPEARTKSFLLGAGLFLLMAAGPLHDNAKTAQVYIIADVFSILSLFILTAGVAYRMEERLTPATKPAKLSIASTR